MAKSLSFSSLWNEHPANNDNTFPCWNEDEEEPNFENQCSIRMSTALHRAGMDLSGYQGITCITGYNFKPECKEPHALRVEELAVFLRAKLGFPQRLYHIDCEEFKKATKNKAGIVVFLDFWGRNMQGDHIDIWDGKEMTYGSDDYFERSRVVWFWRID